MRAQESSCQWQWTSGREYVMRKIIVSNIMSLDGYYTGPDDNVMVMPMGDAFDNYNVERLRAADMLLLGRKSYEGFRGYWPRVADDPTASADNREISRLNTAMEKVVISDSLATEQTGPWSNTRVIRRADAHAQLAALKQQEGKEILIFGSHTLWTDLLAHELVDELHLMIGHVTVGGGTPIFPGPRPLSLRLIDTPRTWVGSDNILARYEVRRQ